MLQIKKWLLRVGFAGLLLGLVFSQDLCAQTSREVSEVSRLWLGYFNQTRLTDRLGVWTDLHYRTAYTADPGLTLAIARVGLTGYLHDQVRLTLGYAYIHHAPTAGHQFVAQPEHRPWAQLQWYGRHPRLRTMQWLRLEERYRQNILNDSTLGTGYYAATRLRYNFALFIPIGGKPFQPHTFFGVLNDELHMNLGKVTQYFDQNRAFAGMGYQLTAHMQVHAGYMQVFQPRSAPGTFTLTHALRIFVFHTIDVRPGH